MFALLKMSNKGIDVELLQFNQIPKRDQNLKSPNNIDMA